jgi:F-type H+-transporting ATPase subunit c
MSLRRKLSLFAAVVTAVVLYPMIALAQSGSAPANKFDTDSFLAGGAALAIGLAALGGTLGQGRATASALEGIARQPSAAPRIQTPLILGLAMIESLVLFAWAMAFLLQMKIGG